MGNWKQLNSCCWSWFEINVAFPYDQTEKTGRFHHASNFGIISNLPDFSGNQTTCFNAAYRGSYSSTVSHSVFFFLTSIICMGESWGPPGVTEVVCLRFSLTAPLRSNSSLLNIYNDRGDELRNHRWSRGQASRGGSNDWRKTPCLY